MLTGTVTVRDSCLKNTEEVETLAISGIAGM